MMAVLAIGMATTMFLSCSKSDKLGNISELIIGRWQLYESNATDDPCDFEGWIEFKTDGTCTVFDACDDTTETEQYTVNGKKITITIDFISLPVIFTVVSITDSKLVWRIDILGNQITEKYKKI